MITLSFDDLRLIAQIRNISDYKEDLIKALSEPETPKPKSETRKPKLKAPKPKTKSRKLTKTRTRTKNEIKN